MLAKPLAAFYQQIPIGHIEAGLRAGNLKFPWPEEANRVLTSYLTTLHSALSEMTQNNLIREGIPPERIFVTGNRVIDALHITVDRVRQTPPDNPGA